MSSSDTDGSEDSDRRVKTARNVFLSKYDEYRERLRQEQQEAQRGEASKLVLEHLNNLQNIYEVVQQERNRDTRVQLKDAEALQDLAAFAATNARNIRFGDVGISLSQKDFVKNVKAYMNEMAMDYDVDEDKADVDTFNSYNWLKLGALWHAHSARGVLMDFMYGPLATERKKRAAHTRRLDDTSKGPLATAREVHAGDLSQSEKNTAQMVRSVYLVLLDKERSGELAGLGREGEPCSVNYYHFFINPHLFAQLVENLFFTSFLVRDGKLKIYEAEGVPMVRRTTREEAAMESKTNAHHIASFDHQTWQAIIAKYNIVEPFLGHRHQEEDAFVLESDLESEPLELQPEADIPGADEADEAEAMEQDSIKREPGHN